MSEIETNEINDNSNNNDEVIEQQQIDPAHPIEGDKQNEEADYQQTELYRSVLNQQSSEDASKSQIEKTRIKKDYKMPQFSRSTIKRSISLKPNTQYTVINEIKYIGEQIKVGKFDPNSRSFNEELFQKHYQKRLAELENKRKLRPGSSLSQRSTVNPSLIQTNDLKYKGSQFKHGKYISTIDLTKSHGKAVYTSSSLTNEITFEDKFQKMFSPRLERLMPKEKPKTLSYFELKELHERLTINRR